LFFAVGFMSYEAIVIFCFVFLFFCILIFVTYILLQEIFCVFHIAAAVNRSVKSSTLYRIYLVIFALVLRATKIVFYLHLISVFEQFTLSQRIVHPQGSSSFTGASREQIFGLSYNLKSCQKEINCDIQYSMYYQYNSIEFRDLT
jgi:hypothetical protein